MNASNCRKRAYQKKYLIARVNDFLACVLIYKLPSEGKYGFLVDKEDIK